VTEDAPKAHRAYAPDKLRCALLTVSDSRTLENDTSGEVMRTKLEGAGHWIVDRAIVPDEPDRIRRWVLERIVRGEVDAIVVSGGTGIAPRDITVETLEPLLGKLLPGFGELFRMLSFEEIGSAAMLSRAVAGTADRTVVFVLPGSSKAVGLALDRLILPELPHLVGQLRR